MPKKRKNEVLMHVTREILRLILDEGLEDRKIGKICSVAHRTVGKYRKRIKAARLTLEEIKQLTDDELKEIVKSKRGRKREKNRPQPDFKWIHEELKKKGVTLNLLWEEYKAEHPEGYESTQFNHLYKQWAKKLNPPMRQTHKAGEKVFVDFSGHTIPITDPESGVKRNAEIFVAVLGASNYTYAEATLSQGSADWIGCHINAFGYFEGVPSLIVPDNLKSAVKTPCRYEPIVNRTYLEMASHYGANVLPARVRKPKDKSKAEVGVQIVSRWILAALRNREFFCIAELNDEIIFLLEKLNNRPFKKLPGSRRSVFESLEQPALKPLPASPYIHGDWKKTRVTPDYHVELDYHYYSVPYALMHQIVHLRYTPRTVEVFHNNRRVASHIRSNSPGESTTLKEHMPKTHQQYLEWTPSKILNWSQQIGTATHKVIQELLNDNRHCELNYRSCLGIKRLSSSYSPERIEAACKRAIAINGKSYKSIESILKNGLDQQPLPAPQEDKTIIHKNVRGTDYYTLNDHPRKPGEYLC